MEVHPPEHGIHSWRDFLVHMGTITLGLLIALSLEAGVEHWHHHNELIEARERIHSELELNRGVIADDRAQAQKLLAATQANIAVLDAPGPLQSEKLFFGWTWNAPENSAYETAKASGVMTLMPYAEAQQYAEIYQQQDIVNEAAHDMVKDRAHLLTPLMRYGGMVDGHVTGALSPQVRSALADNCAQSLAHIGLVLDLTARMDNAYSKGLAHQ